MPDSLTLALIILGFLIVLLFSLNFKIARENEAHVVERIGGFYKIVKGPALFFNVPLLDRVVQVVPLQQQEINIKINDSHHIYFRYEISDIKMFVYASLDSIKSLKEYIKNNITFENETTQEITEMVHDHAKIYGINILEFHIK